MNIGKTVTNVCSNVELFLTSLRMGRGVNAEEFDSLCLALRTAEEALKGSKTVPKRLAYYLVDLNQQMWMQAAQYPKDQRQKIHKSITLLDEITHSILAFEGE